MEKPTLKKIKTVFGITEYQLSNGLQVLYKREVAAPVVAVCITFHVGSRNEAPGHTGSTHFLEHLLFKDTKKFNRKNKKELASYLEFLGADLNATTSLDRTNYYELVPKKHFAAAVTIEADRMRNSLFSEEDLKTEMTVVRNEYERSRNNPFELLDEKMMAAAFTTHSYRIPTIGTREDIENTTVGKLREFYDTFYWPNNATLSVFGDVNETEMRKVVLKHFGAIPTSPQPIPQMQKIEPEQTEARSLSVALPLGISIASLAYKIPQGTHPDYPALFALATLLAGGFSSRLQKRLVDEGLAADIMVLCYPLYDPGILIFMAHVAEGKKPKEVILAMRKTIAEMLEKMPRTEELARVKERILAQAAYERDGVLMETHALSESIAAGDWALGYKVEKALQKLAPRDIQRVAKKYLVEEKETAAILVDKKE